MGVKGQGQGSSLSEDRRGSRGGHRDSKRQVHRRDTPRCAKVGARKREARRERREARGHFGAKGRGRRVKGEDSRFGRTVAATLESPFRVTSSIPFPALRDSANLGGGARRIAAAAFIAPLQNQRSDLRALPHQPDPGDPNSQIGAGSHQSSARPRSAQHSSRTSMRPKAGQSPRSQDRDPSGGAYRHHRLADGCEGTRQRMR